MTQSRILIADDEPLYLRTTGELLRKAGYECVCVSDANQAIESLRQAAFDLVLSDLNMPGNLKLELLHQHYLLQPGTPLIVITGVPSLPTAIESIRLGIADYLLKPVKFEDLLTSVRRALGRSHRGDAVGSEASPTLSPHAEHSMRHASVSQGAARQTSLTELTTAPSAVVPSLPGQLGPIPGLLGSSPPMLELYEIVQRVATTDTNILITGESGTGKEVVAKAIHQLSHRRSGMFQVIDCTAIPDTLFESMLFGHKKGAFTGAISDQAGLLSQCHGGTAFFDELGELPLPSQAKLLRAVQEQTFIPVGSHTPVTVNTRFICATNRDLQMEVQAGRFRQDLFYRLGVIHIDLPPLRQRSGDVMELAEYFLRMLLPKNANLLEFSQQAAQALISYHWPGNIRELRNVIERAIALATSPYIDVLQLPNFVRNSSQAAALAITPSAGTAEDGGQTIPAAEFASKTGCASRESVLQEAEYHYLVDLLKRHSGNVSEAARQAGISRQGLHKLLNAHALQAADFR